eukprot:2004440-Rhodomonas_salina.1
MESFCIRKATSSRLEVGPLPAYAYPSLHSSAFLCTLLNPKPRPTQAAISIFLSQALCGTCRHVEGSRDG